MIKGIFARAQIRAQGAHNAPKINKLRLCNASLMIVAVLMLISSIQMEALAGDSLLGISFETLTFIHAGIGLLMFSLVAWHLYLHFGDLSWQGLKIWAKKLQKSPRLTKNLAIFGAITLFSGIFVLAYMLIIFEHNAFGGIHGKIGFVFIALCVIHIYKYWAWIKRKIFNK